MDLSLRMAGGSGLLFEGRVRCAYWKNGDHKHCDSHHGYHHLYISDFWKAQGIESASATAAWNVACDIVDCGGSHDPVHPVGNDSANENTTHGVYTRARRDLSAGLYLSESIYVGHTLARASVDVVVSVLSPAMLNSSYPSFGASDISRRGFPSSLFPCPARPRYVVDAVSYYATPTSTKIHLEPVTGAFAPLLLSLPFVSALHYDYLFLG